MSIKSNKTQTIIKKSRKGTNTKITFVFEDEYDWCFPDTVWASVKDFLGIFDKVIRIDTPFLTFIQKPFPKRTPQGEADCWTDIQEQEPDKDLCAYQWQYNIALNKKNNLRREIRDRCLRDPTYLRLQAYKFFQEKPPLRKGVVYPDHTTGPFKGCAGSYDLDDHYDNKWNKYYESGKYGPSIRVVKPPTYWQQKRMDLENRRADEVADECIQKWSGEEITQLLNKLVKK